jgi:hypothetical protein
MSLAGTLGLFVLAVACVTILTRLALHRVGKAAGAHASQRFRDAEYIIEHGRPPEAWRRALARLDEEDRPGVLASKREELIRFFRNAPVFEDERTRSELLDRLIRITASF